MQELMLPLTCALEWVKELQSWNEPIKTITFLLICSYIVLKYVLISRFNMNGVLNGVGCLVTGVTLLFLLNTFWL